MWIELAYFSWVQQLHFRYIDTSNSKVYFKVTRVEIDVRMDAVYNLSVKKGCRQELNKKCEISSFILCIREMKLEIKCCLFHPSKLVVFWKYFWSKLLHSFVKWMKRLVKLLDTLLSIDHVMSKWFFHQKDHFFMWLEGNFFISSLAIINCVLLIIEASLSFSVN